MLKELRKMQLNKPAPSFGLLDLLGNRVNSSDLLGKVVIIDFWATWCKPCKAAFPAMQKLVNSYHNDSNVVFLFIDTWETGNNTERNVADYMQQNKYSFHVLFDKDNKLIEQFKASGVPAKYVIDKNGILRFASIGFPGEDKLTTEINLMIKLASQS